MRVADVVGVVDVVVVAAVGLGVVVVGAVVVVADVGVVSIPFFGEDFGESSSSEK